MADARYAMLTDAKLDYWLGDATNKQARINLRHECKHDPELKKDILKYWRENNDAP